VALRLLEGLPQYGFRAQLLVKNLKSPLTASLPPDAEVYNLDLPHILATAEAQERFAQAIEQLKPDLVYVHGTPRPLLTAALARKRYRLPFRLVGCNHSSKVWYRLIQRPELFFETRLACRLADGLVTVSRGAARQLGRLVGRSADQIAVLDNPVIGADFDRLASKPCDEPWLREKSLPVVLGVGLLDRRKRFDLLLQAMARVNAVRPVRCLILGKGNEREKLIRQAERLGLASLVRLAGYVDNPLPYMRECDLFVLASDAEAAPLVLAEALMAGTKVLATDTPWGGPRDLIEYAKSGELVARGDATALAQAILKALDAPSSPAEKAEVKQRLEARFGFAAALKGHAEFLRALLAQS
jgi:glycosyltransferase involved in cell wall biosynthesis